MKKVLAILASGKSSRFGGYPKAFCQLGDVSNIENTIRLAQPYFDKIYVVINKETHASGIDKGLNASVLCIVTGQGDADSLLKALKLIKEKEPTAVNVTACWGDAVFLDATPFKEMQEYALQQNRKVPAIVGCSIDREPYAWFETKGDKIICSHFQQEGDICQEGIHDQSIFFFQIDRMIAYLERYKKYLGLDVYDTDSYDSARGEMKLLHAFTYFCTQKDMEAAEYCNITAGRVKSFNTAEELQIAIEDLKKFRNPGEEEC